MLNTGFPRLPGDIGNPDSLRWPMQYRKVEAATVERIVTTGAPDEALQQLLLDSALQLQQQGCKLIVTSCGFLASMQHRFSQRLQVPVISSSLVLIPFLRAVYGAGSLLGVITFDSRTLRPLHFAGHYDEQLCIAGIEQSEELYPVIRESRPQLNRDLAEAEVVAVALALQQRRPDIRALLLECTNLSPYRQAIQRATGLPVYDLISAIDQIMAAGA